VGAVAFGIRALRREDVTLVEGFPPDEWHFAFGPFLELHLGWPYFHPIVATANDHIVGVGNAIVNGDTAWLGNIVVPPPERGRGIGARLTTQLIEDCRERGAGTLVLIATEMGERVYRKLGFETTGLYRFYRGGSGASAPELRGIRPMAAGDRTTVLELDREASGERRGPLLSRFFDTGFVHQCTHDGSIDGCYLPDLGSGLVIAANDEAGIHLLRLKLQRDPGQVVVPDGNEVARHWLTSNGYAEALTAPRMCLGTEVAWRPDRVFSRGAGYCG
jgi:GNAT superfamily N-acetyltransferase